MTRKEFLRISSLLGLGLPLQASLTSCEKQTMTTNFEGKVLVIGAGIAGLSAGYLLQQQGIEFEILEAASTHGGRVKRTLDFADFPIPLGGEWLHIETSIFEEIVNDNTVEVSVNTKPYNATTDFGLSDGEQISISEAGLEEDRKFIGTSWLDFYEEYIIPSITTQIRYSTVVESIDYSGEKILVKTTTNQFSADKLILTVPVKILQQETISFTPALPGDKLEAINEVTVWDGCKAFIEFSEQFYPTFVDFEVSPETAGQKLYYDAAYGQNTTQHILGLFAVGSATIPYFERSGDDLINFMLNELDEIFDGKASASYLKHIFQNWTAEPHIGGAYINDHEKWRSVRTLGESVADKLFFAGADYTDGTDWGGAHTAARAAKTAVEEVLT